MQKLLVLLCGCILLFSCATRKPLPEPPVLCISAVAVSAIGIGTVVLSGELSLCNASSVSASTGEGRTTLSLDGTSFGVAEISGCRLAPGEEKHLPFRFEVNLPAGEGDEIAWKLDAEVAPAGGSGAALSDSRKGSFPRIREPIFRIDAIRILKAELVNTKLEVSLHVDNPNVFPVSFDSLSYELFGEGKYWAEGKAQAGMAVAAKDSLDTKVLLVMDFIDMGRPLLDQVIRLEEVNYRFKGEALVGTGLAFLPRFCMGFDEKGTASVSE